jgi:glycosyltransferase involved in cell wall biosynthesis
MRIAILILTRGNVSGGFRKYLERLVPLLREQDEVDSVDVVVPPAMAHHGDLTWPERDELRGFRELKRRVAALDPDVLFIPTARFLRAGRKPVVTMVRNMEPLEIPFGGNTAVEGMKNVARAAAARIACRRADRVIAVSEHVRDHLVARWDIAEERVGTVRHGVDVAVHEVSRPASIPEQPFLFTAGSIRPARGLEDVIAAMAALPKSLHLVIAGSVDRGAEHYASKMRALATDRGVASRIVWAAQLDAASMAWCFRNAQVFVMTSRAEACPNVVLEALANGALSVSTDHPPMPEFFAEAATYYRARDAGHLAMRLNESLALSVPRRAELRDAARARAALYSWESTARATVGELQRAIAAGVR